MKFLVLSTCLFPEKTKEVLKDDNARFLSPTVPKQRSIKSLKKPLMSPGPVFFICMLLPMLLRYHVPGCLASQDDEGSAITCNYY